LTLTTDVPGTAKSIALLTSTLKTDTKREIGLRVLTQAIDTTSPGGRLVFHVFAAVAEFERELTLERTHAGLAQTHLTDIRAKLRELKALESTIAQFVASCDAQCAGGPGPDCVILDDLGAAVPRRAAGSCCG